MSNAYQDTNHVPKGGKPGGGDIKDWNPEDTQFWESTGKSIASRNLWISIPSLWKWGFCLGIKIC